MTFSKERIQYLCQVWTDRTATGAEENELMAWIQEAEEDSELKEFMLELWQKFSPAEDFNYVNWNSMFDRIARTIRYENVYPIERKRKVFSLIKVAAAVVVLAFIVSGYLFLADRTKSDKRTVYQTSDSRFKNDISPAQDQAILTLSDGSTIILDSVDDGSVATTQGNVQVIKLNDQLSYNSSIPILRNPNNNRAFRDEKEMLYNTITTPKGKQFTLTLSDGTKIWLNASSSIRFPASFIGKERTVELSGEGYFEVAKNTAKPFHVKVNDMDVQVLGTHFNINAYTDEAVVKTTLLEGSVKISLRQAQGNARLQMLTPGQQAQLTKEGDIKLVKDANTDQAVAWLAGLFDFNNDELPDIMRQLSRWYDIDVVYNGTVPAGHYSGGVRRQANISEVLKILETPGDVEFSIDGKTIVVTAK